VSVRQKTCERVKKNVKTNDVDSLFYAASVVGIIKSAKGACEVVTVVCYNCISIDY
jgi:hypothetical protein